MNIQCSDRERIFQDGTAEEWAALEAHAAVCAACRSEVEGWRGLSAAAQELHQEWDSAWLWPRIERALEEQSRQRTERRSWLRWALPGWQTAAAGLLLAAVTAAILWHVLAPRPGPIDAPLISDSMVREVERTEAAYERAIDKLDERVRPQLEGAVTPLAASYREKLQVLDGAIAELQAEANSNPGNGHLRRQLLAMYQEKKDTLEQVLEAKP